MHRLDRHTPGFVLIELIVVIGLIGMIAGIAFPYLLPAIAFSELEGAARRLKNYGQSALAHSSMMRERITIMMDLDAQEYWCVRWLKPEDEDDKFMGEETGGEGEKGDSEDGMFNSRMFLNQYEDMDEAAMDEQQLRMEEQFERYARLRLQARAKNVKHDSIMDEFGPLFDEEFTLDDNEQEEMQEELVLPLLSRTRVPEGVWIEAVEVGGTEYAGGTVEIDITPLGFYDPVMIYVTNEDGDYYTVEWDPMTAGTRMYEGIEDGLT